MTGRFLSLDSNDDWLILLVQVARRDSNLMLVENFS
jgi:hypothetical protein